MVILLNNKLCNDIKEWFFEPILIARKLNSLELMWIPLFLAFSIIPIFVEHTLNNYYVNILYNFLIVFFTAYLSNKIPFTINLLYRFYRKITKNNTISEKPFFDDYLSFGCSQIRTFYSIGLFLLAITFLKDMNNPCNYKYFIILIFSLLIAYRTILYILQSFLSNNSPPAEFMDHQIAINVEHLKEKKEVKIIK